MMRHAIKRRRRHCRIANHFAPPAKLDIARDEDRAESIPPPKDRDKANTPSGLDGHILARFSDEFWAGPVPVATTNLALLPAGPLVAQPSPELYE